jgi:hypothetical protein
MALILSGNTFVDCGVGVSLPAGAHVVMDDNHMLRCGKAIEVRDPVSLLESLGLPTDTPIDLVVQTIVALQKAQPTTKDAGEKVTRGTALYGFLLAKGADVASIVSAVISIAQTPLGRAIVQHFGP